MLDVSGSGFGVSNSSLVDVSNKAAVHGVGETGSSDEAGLLE